MDSEGRIGGERQEDASGTQEETEEEDFPFGEDELMFEDEGEEVPEMAAGGVLPPTTFDPSKYGLGFSVGFGSVPGVEGSGPAKEDPKAETKTYINAGGSRISIQFIDGKPQQPIPVGFYPEGSVELQNSKPEGGDRKEENQSLTRENTESRTPEWGEGKDWANMSADEASALANSRLNNKDKGLGMAAGLVGAINPLAGMFAGVGLSMRPVAEVNGIENALRASGNESAADAVGRIGDGYVNNLKPGLRALEPVLASGKMVGQSLLNNGYGATKTTSSSQNGNAGSGGVRDTSGVYGGTTSSANKPTVGEKPSLSYGNVSPSKGTTPGGGYSMGTPEGENFNGGLDPQKDEDKTATEDRRAKGGFIKPRKKK